MPKGKSNRKYAGDFKQKAIEDMRQNGLSLGETARKYKIVLSMVQRWERIYLEEGPKDYTLSVADELVPTVALIEVDHLSLKRR